MSRKTEVGFAWVIVVLLVALLGASLYFSKPWDRPSLLINKLNPPFISNTSSTDLGAKIYQQTQNPVSALPETNPFSRVNPFKGVYKNPFQ